MPVRTFRIAGWKIWYGDGSTFSSAGGAWSAAPREGILHVFVAFEPNPVMFGYVLSGLECYPPLTVGDEMIAGMEVTHEHYHETLRRAATEFGL